MSAAGLLAVTTLAGAGTYALFANNAVNSGNAFTAGTVNISSVRDDVPNVGPMFYTDTNGAPGTLATGVWAPGDSNTRGLFLQNNGSLDAKLKALTAKSADSSGSEVINGAAYTSDIAFANHSQVMIWQLNWYDFNNTPLLWGQLGANEINLIMQVVNDGYNLWAANNPNADPSQVPNSGDLIVEAVNQQLLQQITDIRNTIGPNATVYENANLRVTKMHEAPMSSLLNQNFDVSQIGISTFPGEAQLIAFTVAFDKDSTNDLQGASGYFNFNTYWEQAKNN